MQIIQDIRAVLSATSNESFANKFEDVLRRNPGFLVLQQINNLPYGGFDGECEPNNEYIETLNQAELSYFKYCPVTSCDVERSFSAYKLIFSDRRKKFLFENLKQHVILYCNFNEEDLE